MYTTKSALPVLHKAGVKYLTIGSNPAPVCPAIPKLHVFEAHGVRMPVAYHPYG